MKRFCLMLFPLILLAACASVVYVTRGPGGDGGLLPVAAQRVIDHATATAAVVATESALATPARVSTLESISDAQTLATLAAARS